MNQDKNTLTFQYRSSCDVWLNNGMWSIGIFRVETGFFVYSTNMKADRDWTVGAFIIPVKSLDMFDSFKTYALMHEIILILGHFQIYRLFCFVLDLMCYSVVFSSLSQGNISRQKCLCKSHVRKNLLARVSYASKQIQKFAQQVYCDFICSCRDTCKHLLYANVAVIIHI